MKKRVFVPYYTEKNIQRRMELDYCIKQNLKCESIDELFLICEGGVDTKDLELYNSSKLIIIKKENRQTFRNIFSLSNDTDNNDINIIINSDIFLTNSIEPIFKIIDDNTFGCLARWELAPDGRTGVYNTPYSADFWIWKGKIKNLDKIDADYYLGMIGCDNRLAYEVMVHGGYKVINPAVDIPSYHVHFSNLRNYSTENRVGGEYLWFYPTKLGETPKFEKQYCTFDWDTSTRPKDSINPYKK